MPQSWLVLRGLRRSVLEAFLYQISPESITTNHRMEQKCGRDADKQKMRMGKSCPEMRSAVGRQAPKLALEPGSRLSLPSLAPRMTFSTALGKLHHFWISLFSPKNEVATFLPLQQCWEGRYCFQGAPKSHQPLCEIYAGDEGFSPQDTPPLLLQVLWKLE